MPRRYLTETNGRLAYVNFGITNEDGTWDRKIRRGDLVRSSGATGRFVGILDTGRAESALIWVAWEEENYAPMVERFDARAAAQSDA